VNEGTTVTGEGLASVVTAGHGERSGLRAPFPYFGGKSRIAEVVWRALGDVGGYVESFAGSAAVLLGRPSGHRPVVETINDVDSFVVNFWRALAFSPDEVERWAIWPKAEADLHARGQWLLHELPAEWHARVESDPTFCDPRIAGWWAWCMSTSIASAWLQGHRSKPHMGSHTGVHRVQPGELQALAARFRRVQILCGDWHRTVSSPTALGLKHCGTVGVFLDPPYSRAARSGECYRRDDLDVAGDVRRWALENADNPRLRIALCGYEGEHAMPESWRCVAWQARGGWSNTAKGGSNGNRTRERVWLSPACLDPCAEGEQLASGGLH